ncbi:MAG: Phenylalanyl-tRNA synthetase alpha chain [Candidatus Ozemobacter sibiricus]|uniref:Phenylalanine--tRNA ligase alpha subunit n=1 Tax=Candidatus Ozemobacter sibiricus TaxID=2268124 RepID=A0A367ZAZ4_9BACT|nr:MAG: Phenylalanyl-tRNA synthetase alpha chain [Candidatus Ozemobacter sibiricus]
MTDNPETLWHQFDEERRRAASSKDAEALRIKYLGKKGPLSALLKTLGSLPPDQRKTAGEAINRLKARLEQAVEQLIAEFAEREADAALRADLPDPTLPGTVLPMGSLHPVTQIGLEVAAIFLSMGFFLAEGPEAEDEYYNFEALNVPKHHPARDMQDTFYLENGQVLRTQTSPVQIRTMEMIKPPFKMIALGKVYRRDSDITHSPMFSQMEGLVVGENVSMADLKGTLAAFAEKMFGRRPTRFRPSFFPFTEPSAEMDVQCIFCEGKGCKVCKNSGWMEILGCGMVNPRVFEAVEYDPEKYTGFAFGMGIERMAMQRFGIDDIRLLFGSDIRFLRQF